MVKTDELMKTEQNRAMPTPNSSSSMKRKYKGVRMRSWGSYVSEVRAPNQKTRIWLGSYSTPEAAARAYDAALICLKGTSANLNFPINPSNYHLLSQDTILSPKSIQRVAAAAASDTNTNTNTNTFFNDSNNPNPSTSFASTNSSYSPSSVSASSSTNHIEDDFSLVSSVSSSFDAMSLINATSWVHFDSPKYLDMLGEGAFFDPTMMEDVYEDADIQLWSFC